MARVLWFGLVGAQVIVAGVVVYLISAGRAPAQGELYPALLFVSLGALVLLTPVAYFVRNQVYKANWRENAVTPRGYVTANVMLLAILESISFIALMAALVVGALVPTALIALVSLGVQAINFPNGTPMTPRTPT